MQIASSETFLMGVARQSGQLVFESRYFIPLLNIKMLALRAFFLNANICVLQEKVLVKEIDGTAIERIKYQTESDLPCSL